jgi:pilus assembly protein CpaB
MRVPALIISLGVSAVLGLAALFVAKTLVPGQATAKVAGASVAQPPPGAPVVVAAKDIKYGEKVDASALRVVRLPPEDVPQGAFTTVAAVLAADHGGAPVVLTPIAAREPVLPAKLSGPGARPSVAAEISEGMRAFTIHVSDVTGVGGHALPGDRVDVVLTRDLATAGATRNYVSQVVLQNVRVLAIDLNADLASDKPATPSNATLEVSVQDSQKLAVAANLGQLSLALRRTGQAELAPAGVVRTSAFVGGGVGEGGVRHAGPRLRVDSGPIEIIYGSHRSGGDGGRPQAPPPAPAAPAAAAAQPVGAAAAFG